MTIGEVIKKYRRENNLTQYDFGKSCGLSKGYISMLEKNYNPISGKGIKPSVECIQKVAKGMGLRYKDLFDILDDNAILDKNTTNINGAVRIPVVGRIAAGIPISAVEDILDYEEIPEALSRTGVFFGLRIKGHSMEPKIENGSTVIVRQQDDVESGSVAVVLVNGDDATCKKVVKIEGGVQLVPLNPNYGAMSYTDEQIAALPVRIVGKVVEIRTRLE